MLPGQSIDLVLSVQDVSAAPTGIFSAFADIVYEEHLILVDGPAVHSEVYNAGTSAGLNSTGLIDEAGGVDGISELGGELLEVLRIPMIVGIVPFGTTIHLGTNEADNMITHPTLVFGQESELPSTEISFGHTIARRGLRIQRIRRTGKSAGCNRSGRRSGRRSGPGALSYESSESTSSESTSSESTLTTEWNVPNSAHAGRRNLIGPHDAVFEELSDEELAWWSSVATDQFSKASQGEIRSKGIDGPEETEEKTR